FLSTFHTPLHSHHYTLSLHDALPISPQLAQRRARQAPGPVLAALGCAAMSFSVLQSLVIPVLPAIGRDLHVSKEAVTWVLTGYRSEEHTSELQSRGHLVCRLLLEKKK